MKKALAASIVALVVIGSAAAGYFGGVSTSHTFLTTTTTSQTNIVRTITLYTNATSTSTTCTSTGGIGCPHNFNMIFLISVDYLGPWGATYQGYLGGRESGRLVESGSFYGHSSTNESVTVRGTDSYGVTLCVEAQKLDASNSELALSVSGQVNNQTSLAFGTAKVCVANVIV